MKLCKVCGEMKELSKFYSNKRLKDGLENRCKKCKDKKTLEWKRNNKGKVSETSAKYYLKNTELIKEKCVAYAKEYMQRPEIKLRVRIKRSNRRCLVKGLPGYYTTYDVENMYIEQLGKCVYCGCSLHSYYEIDHIIPVTREGSTNFADNLQLLCGCCNKSKTNKTHEEYIEYLNKKEGTK